MDVHVRRLSIDPTDMDVHRTWRISTPKISCDKALANRLIHHPGKLHGVGRTPWTPTHRAEETCTSVMQIYRIVDPGCRV
jgi:hypothetical protein